MAKSKTSASTGPFIGESMRRKLIFALAIVDVVFAIASWQAVRFLCVLQRATVMSSFSELEHTGAVDFSRIDVPRWQQLEGAPLQKAEQFLLDDSGFAFLLFFFVPFSMLIANACFLVVLGVADSKRARDPSQQFPQGARGE